MRNDPEQTTTFRVYDAVGRCVDEFTGTISDWQKRVTRQFLPSTPVKTLEGMLTQ